jgi:hypothetical protein
LKETGHQLGGLSHHEVEAPWIDAVTIPTADRKRDIDPRQKSATSCKRLLAVADVHLLGIGRFICCQSMQRQHSLE